MATFRKDDTRATARPSGDKESGRMLPRHPDALTAQACNPARHWRVSGDAQADAQSQCLQAR